MSITVLWDDPEQTTLRYIFNDRWDWNELYAALDKGRRAKDMRRCVIDSIYDMESGLYVPAGVISQFRRLARMRHRNDGIYIAVSNSSFARSIFNLFCVNFGDVAPRYYLVDSLDAARLLAAKQRTWRKHSSS